MKTTAHELFYGNQITTPVLVDYFGDNIGNDETINIIMGVYKGLRLKGVSAELLHKCFMANRLDELIHKKYTHQKSRYYKGFVDCNIVIGKTCYLPDTPEDLGIYDENDELIGYRTETLENFEILDDNHCPSCKHVNYFTENYIQEAPPDCAFCGKPLCEKCKSRYNEKECSYVCSKCNENKLSRL